MVLFRLHVLSEIFCLLLFSVDTLEEVLIEESCGTANRSLNECNNSLNTKVLDDIERGGTANRSLNECNNSLNTKVLDDIERASIESLHAPRDGSVELPCDISPALADDSMALVIWYKQGHDAPIYSLDLRDGVMSHWSDLATLGPRATFRANTTPAVLIITRLRAEDSGQYRCRVDFTKSPTKNTRLNLTVLIPPERLMILNQEGKEVRGRVLGPYDEHTNVTLTCLAVGGRPPARVSWWKSHALLANSETRATVSFQLTRSDYGTNITCQAVTDPSLAPVSETLSIDMNLHLLWVRLLGGKRPLVVGQSTELVCQAAGARPKPNFSWWKGGVRLMTVRETISPDGNVSSSILTLVPSIDDAGRVLSCRAQQSAVPHSAREDGWKLEIQHLPVVTLKLGANLDAVTIVEGSDVYLDCMVKANPWHTYVYFTHNGAVVKPGPGVLLANQSLVLQHVSRRAAGAYVCAARSALGEGASDTLILDVKYSPSCKLQQPSIVRAARGELVDFRCDLDANPQEPMSYVWWFNSSTHDKHELAVPTVSTHHSMGTYSFLVSSPSSYGWVQCAGTNSVGQQAAPCVITILPAEKPSAVTGCNLTDVAYNSLSVTCARGHDGGLTQTFVLHAYDLETGVLLRNISSSEPHFVVWGLSDSSGVRLTVRAVNKQGESEPATLTTSLLNNPHKQTALAPVAVKLSPVLLLVLCAGAVLVTVTALVAILMCTRYYKRHDDKEKAKRKQDVMLNKSLTQYEDYENDKNPDIIPIESKISDTCSNMSSTTDHSSVRPLLSRTNVDKYDEPVDYERYYDHYECNKHMKERPIDYRRQYQPNLDMHIPSIPNIRPNVQSAGPCENDLHNMRSEKYQFSHDVLYEDWLKYKNSLPHNTGLQFLAPSAIPPQSLYAQPRPLRLVDRPHPNYRIELRTDSPLSADTTVYYSRSPHERDNTLSPATLPVSATTEFTNTTSDQ